MQGLNLNGGFTGANGTKLLGILKKPVADGGFGLGETEATNSLGFINNAISKAASVASGAVSSATTGTKGIFSSAISGLSKSVIDTRQNDSIRVDLLSFMGDAANTLSLNPITLLTNFVSLAVTKATDVLADMAALNNQFNLNVKGSAGIIGTLGDAMAKELRESLPDAVALGVSVADFIDATKTLMAESGKMTLYSKDTIDSAFKASQAYTKNSRDLLENAENFRRVGIGLGDAAAVIEKIGTRSYALGLNARQTSETLMKNLDKMNLYGFKNGIDGLGKMVQESQSLNINMQATFDVAEKLFDPDKAIDMAANLQVIGGAVGDFANPLKAMYDATNNVEALQTSLVDAAKSLATYNTEQGRFEITGINLRKARAMADALGVSVGDLTNMAIRGANKLEAMSKIDMFPNISPEQKEFVSNIATMKNGKIGIDLPKDVAAKLGGGIKQGFVALDSLNGSQLEQLAKIEQELADSKPEDIARQQFNAVTQIKDILTAFYIQAGNRLQEGSIGKGVSETAKDTTKYFVDSYKNNSGDVAKFLTQVKTDVLQSIKEKTSLDATNNDFINSNFDKMLDALKPVTQTQTTPTQTSQTNQSNLNIHLSADNVMEPLNRDIIRNTHIFDKWAERNMSEYTAPPKK